MHFKTQEPQLTGTVDESPYALDDISSDTDRYRRRHTYLKTQGEIQRYKDVDKRTLRHRERYRHAQSETNGLSDTARYADRHRRRQTDYQT